MVMEQQIGISTTIMDTVNANFLQWYKRWPR